MVKFGRRGLKTDYRTLSFAKYATTALPAPPPKADQFARAMTAVGSSDFGALFPMDFNDTLGCCTIAGLAHAVTLFEGMVGQGLVPAAADVRDTYLGLSGGADGGLYCLDVLKYVQANRVLGGEKILAYAAVDPRNHLHVKQAIALFGCVYLGFRCQASAVEDFQAGRVWDYSGDLTQDGHCVVAGGYDDATGLLSLATWGGKQSGTWAWWDETVDEAWAILPQEASNPAFAPGLNLAQLAGDLVTLRS